MAYTPSIPNEANFVRGASGDLVLMAGNFDALAPLVSGYVLSGTAPSADLAGFHFDHGATAFRLVASGDQFQLMRFSGGAYIQQMIWPQGAGDIQARQAISGQTPTIAAHLTTKAYVDALTLDSLADVTITGPIDNEGLVYSGGIWRNRPVASSLAGLSDVALAGPVSGESLVYNGAQWVNSGISGGSGSATLSGLLDVVLTAPAVGDILTLSGDGINWVDAPYDRGIFSLADGTRPFTGTVSGVTPTQPAHLATKAYVDTLSGLTISGAVNLPDLLDVDDDVDLGTDGQVLTISGGTWFAMDPTGSGSGGADILQVQIFS